VLLISIAALGLLALAKRYREVTDLVLLGILALVAPPLVAFAVYFGCWHAVRHTARLTLLLPKSISYANSGEPAKSFWAAVLPGLPALLLTLVVAVLTLVGRNDISSNYFWTLLVIVWALTVPHMIVTARIDKKALN
jgi:Brp/Blh family beta-carotene 15,15'-monooxygenase